MFHRIAGQAQRYPLQDSTWPLLGHHQKFIHHRITVLPSQPLPIAPHCLGHPSRCHRLDSIWLPPTRTAESTFPSILVQPGTLRLVRLPYIILRWQAAAMDESSTQQSTRVVFSIRLISASRGHRIPQCLRQIPRWHQALTPVLLLHVIGRLLHPHKRESSSLRRKETDRCFARRTMAQRSLNAPVRKGCGPPS